MLDFDSLFSFDGLCTRLLALIPLWLSLTVHEWAHAQSARLLGDDTAEALGRLTLNPIAHFDALGTVVLPLLGLPIGWAKPVPVNPTRFRHGMPAATGMVITALAGPASNLVLAAICLAGLAASGHYDGDATAGIVARMVASDFFRRGLTVNVALAAFNLLPLPPLDGSRLIDRWCPEPLRPAWDRLTSLGGPGLIVVLVLLQVLGLAPFAWLHKLIAALLAMVL